MSLVRLPRARSPSVEKKSSISFSRRRLRFSASSRARSEFLSLISSIRFLFLSCSISCSSLSICAHIAELDSSSLQRAEHRGVRGQYRDRNALLLMKDILDGEKKMFLIINVGYKKCHIYQNLILLLFHFDL